MKLEGVFDRFRHVGMRELAIVSRQFATLIGSGMPMLRTLYTLEDQTEDETIKSALGGTAAGRRGRKLARRRDGAPPGRLQHPVPLDGPLGGELGPPRGGAGADRLPLREARRPSPPDPLGDDVPDVRDGPGVRDHDRRRRVHRPRLHRRVRGDRRGAARRKRGPAAPDPDHGRGLGLRHGLLVHLDPGPDRRDLRLHPVEEDRERAPPLGPGEAEDPCAHRRHRPEGRPRPLVADLRRHGLLGCADPAVDSDHRVPPRAAPCSRTRWTTSTRR